MLEITQLRFSYAATNTEGLGTEGTDSFLFDLKLKRGQIIVVEGRSGIGKTTLLNLVAGFLTPHSGRMTWHGTDISTLKPQDRPLSMIFQEGNLFDHLSVRDNMALGLNPSLALSRDEWGAVDKAMQDLGISGLAQRLPEAISGGQHQRVALGRALLRAEWQARHLLLFDEPFSALDSETRQDCIDMVRGLVAEKSMAALMVSHDPEDARRLAAEVMRL